MTPAFLFFIFFVFFFITVVVWFFYFPSFISSHWEEIFVSVSLSLSLSLFRSIEKQSAQT